MFHASLGSILCEPLRIPAGPNRAPGLPVTLYKSLQLFDTSIMILAYCIKGSTENCNVVFSRSSLVRLEAIYIWQMSIGSQAKEFTVCSHIDGVI